LLARAEIFASAGHGPTAPEWKSHS
jgi:hypothetical protein